MSIYTGISHKIGEVHEGTAVMDWMNKSRSVELPFSLLLPLVTGRNGSSSSNIELTSSIHLAGDLLLKLSALACAHGAVVVCVL